MRRQRPNTLNGVEGIVVLNFTPNGMLRAPPGRRTLVGIYEKVGAGRTGGPSDHTTRHDGTVTAALRIPGRAVVGDGLGALRTRSLGNGGGIYGSIGRLEYALQYSRLLGPIQVAGST